MQRWRIKVRETCIKMVYELAKKDERVLFIGSDLSPGLLKEMQEEFPERYFMEGVYEANIIGMAAGLAMDGYIPYINTIGTFITRRCFEQIAIDICMHNLPVRLIGSGGGVVYAPLGPTHLAVDDLSIMRTLPNMTIVSVNDAEEMKRFMLESIDWPYPIYIRLGKGGDPILEMPESHFQIGKAISVYGSDESNLDIVLMSTGIMTFKAVEVAKQIEELHGISVSVVHHHTVKPLDNDVVLNYAQKTKLIVTIEENTLIGGFGSAITDCIIQNLGKNIPLIKCFGLPDKFVEKYGTQDQILDYYGLGILELRDSISSIYTRFCG